MMFFRIKTREEGKPKSQGAILGICPKITSWREVLDKINDLESLTSFETIQVEAWLDGIPSVKAFVIEKRKKNGSSKWYMDPDTFVSSGARKGYLGVPLLHSFEVVVFEDRHYDSYDENYNPFRPRTVLFGDSEDSAKSYVSKVSNSDKDTQASLVLKYREGEVDRLLYNLKGTTEWVEVFNNQQDN